MPDALVFDRMCEELEGRTSLDRLEARGTIRLALKSAGLEARSVTPDQMVVVVERVLPAELRARGIPDEESVCAELAALLGSASFSSDQERSDSPDQVFRRLGG